MVNVSFESAWNHVCKLPAYAKAGKSSSESNRFRKVNVDTKHQFPFDERVYFFSSPEKTEKLFLLFWIDKIWQRCKRKLRKLFFAQFLSSHEKSFHSEKHTSVGIESDSIRHGLKHKTYIRLIYSICCSRVDSVGIFARLFGLYDCTTMATIALHHCISAHNRSRASKVRSARMEYTVWIQSSRFCSQRTIHTEPSWWNWSEKRCLMANTLLYARRSDVWRTCYRRFR